MVSGPGLSARGGGSAAASTGSSSVLVRGQRRLRRRAASTGAPRRGRRSAPRSASTGPARGRWAVGSAGSVGTGSGVLVGDGSGVGSDGRGRVVLGCRWRLDGLHAVGHREAARVALGDLDPGRGDLGLRPVPARRRGHLEPLVDEALGADRDAVGQDPVVGLRAELPGAVTGRDVLALEEARRTSPRRSDRRSTTLAGSLSTTSSVRVPRCGEVRPAAQVGVAEERVAVQLARAPCAPGRRRRGPGRWCRRR